MASTTIMQIPSTMLVEDANRLGDHRLANGTLTIGRLHKAICAVHAKHIVTTGHQRGNDFMGEAHHTLLALFSGRGRPQRIGRATAGAAVASRRIA